MSEMKLIIENWNEFLNEQQNPGNIQTIGELYDYFKRLEPGRIRKSLSKYGPALSKILGTGASAYIGIMTGGAGAGVGMLAGEKLAEAAVEAALSTAILAFANIEDGTYPAGSVADYFDLDDNLTLFMRELEQKKAGSDKASLPELEVFQFMVQKVKDAISGSIDPNEKIDDVLDVTSKQVMSAMLKRGNFGGKVNVTPVS